MSNVPTPPTITYSFAENVLHYSHIFSLICTFLFNGILCLLLHKETRKELQLYRKVLYVQCFSDMIVSVCYYFSALRFVMIDGLFMVFSTNPMLESTYTTIFGITVESKYISLFLYPFPTGLAIVFVPLNFYYRYQQVVK